MRRRRYPVSVLLFAAGDSPAYLAARVGGGVDVGVGRARAHRRKKASEITDGESLTRWADDVCGGYGPGYGPRGSRTRRFAASSTEEGRDSSSCAWRAEVDVSGERSGEAGIRKSVGQKCPV